MWNLDKMKRLFTFDKIVGYATIVGSVATVMGAKIINDFSIELQPIIKIIQEEQKDIGTKIIRDTITFIHKDTVILKEIHRDTITKSIIHNNSPLNPMDEEKEQIDNADKIYRELHNLL
ncbi:MAG: hypothetical protein K2N34_16285 [Lachnospiraceae bacterium]|nr:hypothetical protein [Lachnospiraceae bacterium]